MIIFDEDRIAFFVANMMQYSADFKKYQRAPDDLEKKIRRRQGPCREKLA
jgi:hypothetical protein